MRKILSCALAAVTILAFAGAPAHAEDTGSIAGRLTDNGAPAANISVGAEPVAFGGSFGSANTDANGEYRIDNLRPGEYRVRFSTYDRAAQYAYGKVDRFEAAKITVTAGAVSTVDDSLLPTGVIQGTFTNPSANARVIYEPVSGGGGAYHQGFVSDGQFRAHLAPGRYRVWFTILPPDFDRSTGQYSQYAGGTDVQSEATIYDVTAGGTITINETMLPTGRMEGRLTDAAGNGLPNVEVSISRPDLGRGPSVGTDANGYFRYPYMRVSTQWRVWFNASNLGFRQYAFGKLREADADPITITEGQTTVVNDSRLPTGTVKVTAKDAVSGVRVEKFQAYLDQAGYGHTLTGEVAMTDVPIGTHPLSVSAYGYEYAENTLNVTVTTGGQAEATVMLRPKTRIEAKVVDAATGQPVPGVCLMAARPQRFVLSGEQCFDDTTSDSTGRVMAEIQEPGWYQVLAFPYGAQGFGAQWVGPTAGTGTQLGAQLIKVEAGGVAKAPTVKLDRAGTITGQITSPSGVPVTNAVVSLGDFFDAGPDSGVYAADEEGRYTIDNLGPYQWPLRFFNYYELGVQWSGHTGTRHLAQRVSVQSGQSTVYDFRFEAPTQVTTNPAVGADCQIDGFNLLTGDMAVTRYIEDCSKPIVLPVTGPQWVRFRVGYRIGNGEWQERFYETRFIG